MTQPLAMAELQTAAIRKRRIQRLALKEDSLAVRKAIIDRLRHRGFTGEVRGISVIDYVGDMLSGRIVAVEANDTLMYFVVYDLEDKDGNTYPRAEPLSGMNASVVYLLKNRPPSASEPQKE